LRAIDRLHEAGHARQADAARAMKHVSAAGRRPRRDRGPLRRRHRHRHAGFPTGLKDVWRHLPDDQVIEVRLWHEPADVIADDSDAQIDWLFGWWQTLDAWVTERESAEQTTVSDVLAPTHLKGEEKPLMARRIRRAGKAPRRRPRSTTSGYSRRQPTFLSGRLTRRLGPAAPPPERVVRVAVAHAQALLQRYPGGASRVSL
jgi:hypothetical protein